MSKSPKSEPTKVTNTMSFTDALNAICADYSKKMTRLEWDDRESYGLIQDTHLRIHLNNKFHDWILNDGDLLADDWIIL